MKKNVKDTILGRIKYYLIGPLLIVGATSVLMVATSGEDITFKALGIVFAGAVVGTAIKKELIERLSE